MTTGERIKVFLLAVLPLTAATLLMALFSRVDFLVEDNPIPFDDRAFQAVYDTAQGEMTVTKAEAERVVAIEIQEQTKEFQTLENGRVPVPDGREVYSPFWLQFRNPVLALSTEGPETEGYPIYDEPGLLGKPRGEYTARFVESFVLMDDRLQSQASYRYRIDDQHGRPAASAVYDATSGLLFRLQVKRQQAPDLQLTRTDFPISRNRFWMGIFHDLLAVIVLSLLIRKGRKRIKAGETANWRRFRLVLLGMLCLGTDTLLDIWHPYLMGNIAPLACHGVLILALLIYGRWMALPALAEVVMAGALWIFFKGPALPFFFIPGLIVSYLLTLAFTKENVRPLVPREIPAEPRIS